MDNTISPLNFSQRPRRVKQSQSQTPTFPIDAYSDKVISFVTAKEHVNHRVEAQN